MNWLKEAFHQMERNPGQSQNLYIKTLQLYKHQSTWDIGIIFDNI